MKLGGKEERGEGGEKRENSGLLPFHWFWANENAVEGGKFYFCKQEFAKMNLDLVVGTFKTPTKNPTI